MSVWLMRKKFWEIRTETIIDMVTAARYGINMWGIGIVPLLV